MHDRGPRCRKPGPKEEAWRTSHKNQPPAVKTAGGEPLGCPQNRSDGQGGPLTPPFISGAWRARWLQLRSRLHRLKTAFADLFRPWGPG